jgi:RNA polymerase sigma-70 factor (ECF subfamily)
VEPHRHFEALTMDGRDFALFERARPRLLGLAYRILGSRVDAEDAVQDCFLKWSAADRDAIDNPDGWLTTICTRRCLDLLRAAHRSRVDYVGAWLPEPIHMRVDPEEAPAELASSLGAAFLLMLERLTPKERAAYLLHEIFDRPYDEIAATLEMEEPACRKLVSRAKANIDQGKVRHRTPVETQQRLLDAFRQAVTSDRPDQLGALLATDIRVTADGGGKVRAFLDVLEGQRLALAFIHQASRWWAGYEWEEIDINGGRGLILRDQGQVVATVSFGYDADDRIADIFITRNPDKLGRLDPALIQ